MPPLSYSGYRFPPDIIQDAEGEVLDVLLQAKRDTKAARKLIIKLLKKQRMAPEEWVTDKVPAYEAALRELRLKMQLIPGASGPTVERKARTCPCDDENGSRKGSSRPSQPSGSCPCTWPPTTPSRFPATLSRLALTASSA